MSIGGFHNSQFRNRIRKLTISNLVAVRRGQFRSDTLDVVVTINATRSRYSHLQIPIYRAVSNHKMRPVGADDHIGPLSLRGRLRPWGAMGAPPVARTFDTAIQGFGALRVVIVTAL